MALTVEDRPIRPLTADEVLQMVERGILADGEPVELLHGVLTRVSPHTHAHAEAIVRLMRWLAPGFGAGAYDVRPQLPLRVPDRTSLPEPDIAVVPPHQPSHPHTALLAIEVAVSSLKVDTVVKAPLYAAADVEEYWIVDPMRRRIEVFSDPHPEGYARRETVEPPATLTPHVVDVEPLDLSALFEGL